MTDKTGYKRTRIIATLGPASNEPGKIIRLIEAGADVFRLNFSHGTVETHRRTLAHIYAVRKKLGLHPGVLADLQGPKIRTGRTEGDRPVTLYAGATVLLDREPQICTGQVISIDYPGLIAALKKDQRVLLNDGAIELRIGKVWKGSGRARAEVLNTGVYSSRKGVNVPDLDLDIPPLTRKDLHDLEFIVHAGIPIIALSFVRRAGDVLALRRYLKRKKRAALIIAKIEKPEAVERIDEILQVSDGIMVARGDLGIEMSPYQLPIVQKDLLTAANAREKVAIVATQMLESMITNRTPTRAEAADVANAILDGADAVMLSAETAVGAHPVEAVSMMSRIACETENSDYYLQVPLDHEAERPSITHALCEAAAWASQDLGHVPALVFTRSGQTARTLSKLRYHARIYAFTPSPQVASSLALAWNVTAFLHPEKEDHWAMQRAAIRLLRRRGVLRHGDTVLILSGTAMAAGSTNQVRVLHIGTESLRDL